MAILLNVVRYCSNPFI